MTTLNYNEIDYEFLVEMVKVEINKGRKNVYDIVSTIFDDYVNVKNVLIVSILVELDDTIKKAESVCCEYYAPNDLKIPWWKFWINKYEIINDINKVQYRCGLTLAQLKGTPPPSPPLRYCRG